MLKHFAYLPPLKSYLKVCIWLENRHLRVRQRVLGDVKPRMKNGKNATPKALFWTKLHRLSQSACKSVCWTIQDKAVVGFKGKAGYLQKSGNSFSIVNRFQSFSAHLATSSTILFVRNFMSIGLAVFVWRKAEPYTEADIGPDINVHMWTTFVRFDVRSGFGSDLSCQSNLDIAHMGSNIWKSSHWFAMTALLFSEIHPSHNFK